MVGEVVGKMNLCVYVIRSWVDKYGFVVIWIEFRILKGVEVVKGYGILVVAVEGRFVVYRYK